MASGPQVGYSGVLGIQCHFPCQSYLIILFFNLHFVDNGKKGTERLILMPNMAQLVGSRLELNPKQSGSRRTFCLVGFEVVSLSL